MSLGYQARAMQRGLRRLGEPAFLRGASAGKVNLARNVQLFAGIGDTADDNPTVRYTIATISNAYQPKEGDLLQLVDADENPIAGESYLLDKIVQDNGFNSRFIVAKA